MNLGIIEREECLFEDTLQYTSRFLLSALHGGTSLLHMSGGRQSLVTALYLTHGYSPSVADGFPLFCAFFLFCVFFVDRQFFPNLKVGV